MRGNPATRGDNGLCGDHAVKIVRIGFVADEDDLFTGASERFGFIGIEYHLARGRTRRGR